MHVPVRGVAQESGVKGHICLLAEDSLISWSCPLPLGHLRQSIHLPLWYMASKAMKDDLDVPRLLKETTQTHLSLLLPPGLFLVTPSQYDSVLLLYKPDFDLATVLLGFQFVLGVSRGSLLFPKIGSDLACPCLALDRSSHMVPRPTCQPCGCVPSRLNLNRQVGWACLQSGSLGEERKAGV